MENVMNVAGYVYRRYEKEFGAPVDEMKLHKLLYFAQRESLIQTDRPLFEATFYGWKYGPVLKEIRGAYRDHELGSFDMDDIAPRIGGIMDRVFASYAEKDSWSLSRLTHGEISWKRSRGNISPNANGDNPMELSDIRQDARRVKARREMLEERREQESN